MNFESVKNLPTKNDDMCDKLLSDSYVQYGWVGQSSMLVVKHRNPHQDPKNSKLITSLFIDILVISSWTAGIRVVYLKKWLKSNGLDTQWDIPGILLSEVNLFIKVRIIYLFISSLELKFVNESLGKVLLRRSRALHVQPSKYVTCYSRFSVFTIVQSSPNSETFNFEAFASGLNS